MILLRVKKIILFLLLLTSSNLILSQEVNVKKMLKQAERKENFKKYPDAIKILDEVLKADTTVAAAWNQHGMVSFKIRDYISAKKDFQKVIELDSANFPLSFYYYALMLKMNGEYYSAFKYFTKFIQFHTLQDDFLHYAKIELQGCEIALDKTQNENEEGVVVAHAGNNINSRYSEMSPVFWDDSTLLYASLPKDTILFVREEVEGDYFIKFFLAEFKKDSFFNPLEVNDFKIPNANVAGACLNSTGTKFYFTVCSELSITSTICQLYMSEFKYGNWNTPERLSSPINDLSYNVLHPSISKYKNDQEIIYFTSDRPGGKGGKDIWYSIINVKGKFSKPENAGALNTPRDEITPFYDNLNGTLYFSSNGHVGYGGFDVYKATGEKNVWTDIANLKRPINSATDDLYFSFLPEKDMGLLVSNRTESNLSGSTCCDDIYHVKYNKPKRIALYGLIQDADPHNNTVFNEAKISLSTIDSLGTVLLLKEKNIKADVPYFFNIKPDKKYFISVLIEGYFIKTELIDTKGMLARDSLRKDIFLEKIIPQKDYRLSQIYFGYNEFELNAEAIKTLDTLYQVLEENPSLKIELSAHTDSRGKPEYNLTLSQKRAEACVNYLINKGISFKRLFATGYGATQPIQDCSKDATCKEEDCECYKMNRRTVFKVLK